MLSWPAFRRSGPETSRVKWIAFWGETNEESSTMLKPFKYKHKINAKDLSLPDAENSEFKSATQLRPKLELHLKVTFSESLG